TNSIFSASFQLFPVLAMNPTKVAKSKKRFGACQQCLICGGKTISAHLGMNVCRACSVFYRRSAGKRVYECRSGTNKCEVNKGESCRKCRLERIEKLLSNNTANLNPQQPSPEIPLVEDSQASETDSAHAHRCEPSSSESSYCCPRSSPILERVREAYKVMSEIRLTSELLARPVPPHPALINEDDCTFERATFGKLSVINQIFLTTIMGFGRSAFPEFKMLSREQQWTIAKNFLYRFGPFESSYRADRLFPDEPERIFAGYTYWITHHYDEHFYSDCPNAIDIEHVKTSMHNFCKGNHGRFRACMSRLKMSEPEFLYLTALFFWSTENQELPENIVAISEKYRTAIMQELHAFFVEEKGMENYAARLGELLTAMQTFDKVDAMRENFEFLRLVNVVSDDSFMYRMHREDAPIM
ncbi:hypothetical protein PMAYCL1PPCAC_16576, partial [Pristionchus mayeri]